MLKRHEDQLWARLDQLYVNGVTFIGWDEIYHWYNVTRISKTPWRDIKMRWEQLLEEKEYEYVELQISIRSGGVAFFYPYDLKTFSDLI